MKPRHTPNLSPFTICRCGDPLCAGLEAGALLPRRTMQDIDASPSGTFRTAARARLERLAKRRRNRTP